MFLSIAELIKIIFRNFTFIVGQAVGLILIVYAVGIVLFLVKGK